MHGQDTCTTTKSLLAASKTDEPAPRAGWDSIRGANSERSISLADLPEDPNPPCVCYGWRGMTGVNPGCSGPGYHWLLVCCIGEFHAVPGDSQGKSSYNTQSRDWARHECRAQTIPPSILIRFRLNFPGNRGGAGLVGVPAEGALVSARTHNYGLWPSGMGSSRGNVLHLVQE